jgi:hydroxymethylpyrimidine pyrophosphatase-like HAD family hydrolase
MPLSAETSATLSRFVAQSAFATRGGIVTDLDGTAVHELEGRVVISPQVELGLKALFDRGRPFAINSLRFPLSVMNTFGRAWYDVSNAPVPAVSLNGSLIGRITLEGSSLAFEELDAFPLTAAEIDEVIAGVDGMLRDGIDQVLLFHYPRDWRRGEIIWTPASERVVAVRDKYRSAASVVSEPLEALRERLHAEPLCMIFLLVDAPQDRLMAYQHTHRSNFVTHEGVDKLSGTRALARKLGISLEDSVGAGDTELDRFLAGVGLSVHVGPLPLEFKGCRATLRLNDSDELGELLFGLARLLDSPA